MSQVTINDLEGRTGVTTLFEKKTYLKIPAEMIMLRKAKGRVSRFIYDVDIISYNLSGVCISWKYCPLCFGYEASKIHDNCYFKPFDIKDHQSQSLHFNIEVPYLNELFTFKGKAVYTYKSKKGEKIGIKFTDISAKTKSYLESYFYRR